MRWPGRRGPGVCDVGALVQGKGYHIRHSSRMDLRRPLEGPLGRLGKECLWLPGLGDGEGRRVFCDRMHVVRWVVRQLWCHQNRAV